MKTYQPHQLMEAPMEEPKEPLDEEKLELLLERSYLVLTTVLERRLPKALHNDVAHLIEDIDKVLRWQQLN